MGSLDLNASSCDASADRAAPRVTVVIPAYNAGPTIEAALRSVVAQTFTDWEAIVVDDGSTDETVNLASSVDPRVTLIQNPRRGGPAAARNLAVAHARGELLALLDADDRWLPTYLEHQVGLFDAEQARDGRVGIVACEAWVLEPGGLRPQPYSALAGTAVGATLETLLRSNPIYVSVVASRKVVLAAGGFEPVAFGVEDHDLWVRILEMKLRVVATDEPLAIYRKHASGISSDLVAMARQSELVYRRALARGRLTPHQRRIARRSLRLHRSVAKIEEFRTYAKWGAVPLPVWWGAFQGGAGLLGYGLLTPRRWPGWAVRVMHERTTPWLPSRGP